MRHLSSFGRIIGYPAALSWDLVLEKKVDMIDGISSVFSVFEKAAVCDVNKSDVIV